MARLEAAQAALDRLDELEEEGAAAEPLRRLRELYRARFARLRRRARRRRARGRAARAARVRRACGATLIAVERAALLRAAQRGPVAADVVRRVERDLDLDEARHPPLTAAVAFRRDDRAERRARGATGSRR